MLFVLFSINIYAQDTSKRIKYSPRFRFKEGIYVSHWNLANNKPIPKSRIITKFNKNSFDFFEQILGEKNIKYYDDFGIQKTLPVKDLWGFCRKGVVFINWGNDFNRITVIGSICHFVATITYYDDTYANNYGYNYNYYNYNRVPNNMSRTEIRQYLMEFETGKILDYNYKNVMALISKDEELFKEFESLKKNKKKKMRFLYVRKYNNKYPLYIPK